MFANLVVRSSDGTTELPIGKTVTYRDRQIVHCFVYGKYMRHTIGAWGVRYPLCAWMLRESIRDVYFWDNKEKCTYHIELEQIRVLGTPGQWDDFGGTLNVPRMEWEVITRRLRTEWVPDEHVIVLPPCAEPWPLPRRSPPDDDAATPVPPTRQRKTSASGRRQRDGTARSSDVWSCRVCIDQFMGGPRCYAHNPTPEMRAANPTQYKPTVTSWLAEPEAPVDCLTCGWDGVARETKPKQVGRRFEAKCPRCKQPIGMLARA